MMHISETTAAEFEPDYDRHGDSFYDDTDVNGLKKAFDQIEPQVIVTQPMHFFCMCFAYFTCFIGLVRDSHCHLCANTTFVISVWFVKLRELFVSHNIALGSNVKYLCSEHRWWINTDNNSK